MLDSSCNGLRFARHRRKRLWATALCAASFLTGQLLFGQDASQSPALNEQPVGRHTEAKGRTAAKDVSLIPARPLAAEADLNAAAVKTASQAEDENLPPIVPAWAVQRPSAKRQVPAVKSEPAAPSKSQLTVRPVSGPAEPLRIELGSAPSETKLASATSDAPANSLVAREASPKPSAGQPPKRLAPVATAVAEIPAIATPAPSKSDVQKVDYESRAYSRQPAPAGLRPAGEDELSVLPVGSPFEAIQQSGSLKLRVRRSILLRTKVDVYRTAIVDESVCDIVQFTPREVSIIGRSVGTTHVTFWLDDPGMAPLTYLVEVQPDPQQIKADENKYELLQNVINEMFPDSKVHLVLVADKLLVKGQAKDSEEAAQIMTIIRAQAQAGMGAGNVGGYGGFGGIGGFGLAQGLATPVLPNAATGGNSGPAYQVINMLRVPGIQQVALRVKIAELNRSRARGFGLDVKAAINFTDSVKTSQLFLASLLNGISTDPSASQGTTSVVTSFGGQDVNIGLRYLQEQGVIRLLSEPTLVTLSGRPATFIAGGEFAVPTIVGSVGINAVTTDFRAFGAIISFLPTIVDKDRIRLQVAPEFSQINSALRSANNTPGLNVRAATTTVEMREGQTLAIAGLLEDTYKATNVGDLPGLAKIFGRRDAARSETELIILVTPELVHPMEPEEVPPLPGFDVTEPTGAQFFFCGEIEGNPTQDYRSTVWPRLRRRYGMGGPAMTSGPFGHGQ